MSPHAPVMLNEVVEALAPTDGQTYVDGTFGAGGYSTAFLDKADCKIMAIDRDPSAVARGAEMESQYGGRFKFIRGCFGDVAELIHEPVDGFVLDIGVSSMQLDQAERGFSFRFDGPLDMRMDTDSDLPSAADIVNNYSTENLANLIYEYGEERKSRRIARAITERRMIKPFETTLDLVEVIHSVMPKSPRDKNDPATRTFQALRIAVNDELGELERALRSAAKILKPGGRLVVVSFHSLEDRMVKRYLRTQAGEQDSGSRHLPVQNPRQLSGQLSNPTSSGALFTLPSRRAIKPTDEETSQNPRARSARLRSAIRLADQAQEGA